MFVGIGIGINRRRFAGGFADSYSTRVLADGGTIESLTCVANASTLLQQASLLFIPSGYKENVAYSALPNNSNGDLTWSRSSTAYRTNSSGQIEEAPYNLLSNSEDFTQSYWLKNLTNIISNDTIAPNGSLTADKIYPISSGTVRSIRTANLTQYIFNNHCGSIYAKWDGGSIKILTVTRGASPDISYNLETGQVVGVVPSGMTASIQSVGNGWYRLIWTYNSSNTDNRYYLALSDSPNSFTVTANGTSGIFIWGAQLVQGNIPRDYFVTTSRFNVTRLSYLYGSCPAALLEPQRTNLVTYSRDYVQGQGWTTLDTGGGVVRTTGTSSAFLDPSGNYNANGLSPRADRTKYYAYNSPVTYTSGLIYTLSVFFKQGQGVSGRYIQLTFPDDKFSQLGFANYDLQLGVVSLISGNSADVNRKATIIQYQNGWYRCTLSCTATSSGVSDGLAIWLADSGTSPRFPSFVGNTSDIVYSWGAQIETGPYETTYIPTSGATATRISDSFTRDNIYTNGLISASGGVWFLQLTNSVIYVRENSQSSIFINSGSSGNGGNGISIRNAGTSRYGIWSVDAGVLTQRYLIVTDNTKLAIRWDGVNCEIFINGTKVTLITGGTSFSFPHTIMENLRGGSANIQQPTFIQAMALYNTPLSDSDCITLTT